MKMERADIIRLIADYPWFLDDRYMLSGMEGEQGMGRGVSIGREGFERQIDLLFQDSRDGRPVIVQVKAGRLTSADVSAMLEFKALLASLADDTRRAWHKEFGRNYYIPQMILVAQEASEDVKMGAALSGIRVSLLTGQEDLDINFSSMAELEKHMQAWDSFVNSGNRTIHEREAWVEHIFALVKDFIEDSGDEELETCGILSTTSLKNSYVRGRIFPFINIPIKYQGKELMGLYEYFDDSLAFSASHIYCDILIQAIYYSGNRESRHLDIMEKIALELLKKKGYDIVQFAGGMATFKVDRSILESPVRFKEFLHKTVEDARTLQEEMNA